MPREPTCIMPIINVRAVISTPLLNKLGQATSSSGGGSGSATTNNQEYDCPVYATRDRGSTYVFSAKLRTKLPSAKWVLAGVALILDIGN
jgi:dynein heavy chain, axonemal